MQKGAILKQDPNDPTLGAFLETYVAAGGQLKNKNLIEEWLRPEITAALKKSALLRHGSARTAARTALHEFAPETRRRSPAAALKEAVANLRNAAFGVVVAALQETAPVRQETEAIFLAGAFASNARVARKAENLSELPPGFTPMDQMMPLRQRLNPPSEKKAYLPAGYRGVAAAHNCR
jgi:hypothetical protein